MSTRMNRRVILSSRPEGIPQAENFRIVETEIPSLQKGQVLIRNHFLAVEPAMRGWVNTLANYAQPVGIGDVMRSFAAGEIIASDDLQWPVGTRVTGMFGWQDYAEIGRAHV